MNKNELIDFWLAEEDAAHIHGWDFSHIEGRYTEETDLPWNYRDFILGFLSSDMSVLDIDTGGGEFLLTLGHPHKNTAAAESYPPNIELCKQILTPLGIDFRPSDGSGILPFESDRFDMVINRHGIFDEKEIHRVLKHGGMLITEQVGAENDRELARLLLSDAETLPFPDQYLSIASEKLLAVGFDVIDAQECFRPIKFYDVGALVWFAKIIEWEFPGFSVKKNLNQLFEAQKILESEGCIEGRIHRFLITARKK